MVVRPVYAPVDIGSGRRIIPDRAAQLGVSWCASYSGELIDEADLSAESREAIEEARVQIPNEDPRGPRNPEEAANEGSKAPQRRRRIEVDGPMGQGGECLPRSGRLLRSRDFQRVARRGIRVASRNFVMLAASSRIPGGDSTAPKVRDLDPDIPDTEVIVGGHRQIRRLGITASRKVGHAVARNGIKRRVREWFRRGEVLLPEGLFRGPEEGVDFVVIARKGAAELAADSVSLELSALVVRLQQRLGGLRKDA